MKWTETEDAATNWERQVDFANRFREAVYHLADLLVEAEANDIVANFTLDRKEDGWSVTTNITRII